MQLRYHRQVTRVLQSPYVLESSSEALMHSSTPPTPPSLDRKVVSRKEAREKFGLRPSVRVLRQLRKNQEAASRARELLTDTVVG